MARFYEYLKVCLNVTLNSRKTDVLKEEEKRTS